MAPSPKRAAVRRSTQGDEPSRGSGLPFDGDEVAPATVGPRGQVRFGNASPRRDTRQEDYQPTSALDVGGTLPPLSGREPVFLFVERGPRQGSSIPIDQGSVVIGRASIADVRLQHPSISRRHAQFIRKGDRFFVKDLGSQNGTFVNKVRIATELEIFPGDQVAVGNALLKLRGGPQQAQADAEVEAQGLSSPLAELSAPASPGSRQTSTRGGVVRVAVVAGAVGFGLAGLLMFAVIKLPSKPVVQKLPAGSTASSRKETPAAPVSGKAEEVSIEVADKAKIDTALREAMRNDPVKPASDSARAERSKARDGEGSRAASHTSADNTPRTARREIVSLFEEGDAMGALTHARKTGEKELAFKLLRFNTAYTAAKRAVGSGDGNEAIRNFTAALASEKQLSGNSTYGDEIHQELARLYIRVGKEFVAREEPDNARLAFEAALKHDPDNDTARSQLRAVDGAGGRAASARSPGADDRKRTGGPRSRVDDAWEDEAETKSPPPGAKKTARAGAKSSVSKSIDDAFGD